MSFRDSDNDFSFWFPKVENCGIQVPKSFFVKLEEEDKETLQKAFYMDDIEKDLQTIREWVKSNLLPELKKNNMTGHLFIKNGRFSNKFDARYCEVYGVSNLANCIANINYAALCCGAGGTDEIVIRQFIEYDRKITPCIYNGLPLRSEFRAFYDFDSRRPIFTANYWDYGYVYPNLYCATDRIIFEHERNRIESAYESHKDEVQLLVARAMDNVTGLAGQWSVDILMDEQGNFWLIDMAVAQRSAYWDERYLKQ